MTFHTKDIYNEPILSSIIIFNFRRIYIYCKNSYNFRMGFFSLYEPLLRILVVKYFNII